ncbi:MAG TPA: hypothetical protein VIK33_17500 [Anaerolineae bacterium]
MNAFDLVGFVLVMGIIVALIGLYLSMRLSSGIEKYFEEEEEKLRR